VSQEQTCPLFYDPFLSSRNDNPQDLTQLKRALASIGIDNRSDVELLKDIGDKGIPVRVDLNQLVHEVILCPNSSHYLNESVEYILKDRVPNTRITKSQI